MAEAIISEQRRESGSAPSDEAIYQEIYAAIVEHRLVPGAKLTEDTLAEIFGVSRTRIAKALQRLTHEKIVTRERNRGAFVTRPTRDDAREVFAARRLLEGEIVALAAANGKPTDFTALRRLVADEERARRTGDPRAMIQFSGQFHIKIAEIAGNKTLTGFLTELVARTSLIIAVAQGRRSSACDEHDHGNLVTLLAAGEAKKAARKVITHLEALERSLEFGETEAPPSLWDAFAAVGG